MEQINSFSLNNQIRHCHDPSLNREIVKTKDTIAYFIRQLERQKYEFENVLPARQEYQEDERSMSDNRVRFIR